MKNYLMILLGLFVFGALTVSTACSTDTGDDDDSAAEVPTAVDFLA
jgi:hypothetical protein